MKTLKLSRAQRKTLQGKADRHVEGPANFTSKIQKIWPLEMAKEVWPAKGAK